MRFRLSFTAAGSRIGLVYPSAGGRQGTLGGGTTAAEPAGRGFTPYFVLEVSHVTAVQVLDIPADGVAVHDYDTRLTSRT